MPSASTLAAFAAAAFVLIAVPGPNMIYLIARSLSEGRRAGLLSALGIETGTLVHTTAAAVGLSALLASSATAFAVVKYAGAAYLVYLVVRALLARDGDGGGRHAAAAQPVSGRHVYRQAVLTQVLNPKVAIFFLAFLPQFIDSDRPAATQILVFGAVLVMMGLAIGAVAALAAGTLSQRLRARRAGGRAWGRFASGGTYLALGIYAALSPAHRATR
jgi:threonine/homoserine/homoserine lactone efflux protein